MHKGQINLQDSFLNQIRKENIPVTIFLVNGFQLKGVIRGFDNYIVMLESEGRQQLVYKHAISTVSPSRPVSQTVDYRRETYSYKRFNDISEVKHVPGKSDKDTE